MEINKSVLTIIILGSVFGGMSLALLLKFALVKKWTWYKKIKKKNGQIGIKIGCLTDEPPKNIWDILWSCMWSIFWIAFWGIILTKILLWLIG